MATVNLGVQRNPTGIGNKGLLRIAAEEASDFEMVEFEFYRDDIERFQRIMDSRIGEFTWVIGERGTGKSEVLAHLYKDIFRSADSGKPRLPIYISVSRQDQRLKVPGGVPSGEVTIKLFNWLCRNALKETFEFLHNYKEKPELYKELRYLLNDASIYHHFMFQLEQDGFELRGYLNQMRRYLSQYPKLKHNLPFNLAVFVDDVDKISTQSAIQFYKDAQQDLSSMTGGGSVGIGDVVILSSVTKGFADEGRQNEGLSYCMNAEEMRSDTLSLYVPELSDLNARDVEEFINRRFRYLHWTGREKGFSWAADFGKDPHNSWDEVVEDPKWHSYDPRSMRNNGALLSLNAWLAARSQVNIRQVLRNLEAILNNCDKPRAELTARILEAKLKSNDRNELREFTDELGSRFHAGSGQVTTRRLSVEDKLLVLNLERGTGELWSDLLGMTVDRIALKVWPDRSTKGNKVRKQGREAIDSKRWHEIQKLTNNMGKGDSAIFQFLKLVVELSEDEKLLPNFRSKNPDDVFSIFSPSDLLRMIRKEAVERKKTEFLQEAATDLVLERGAKRTVKPAGRGKAGDVTKGISGPFSGIVTDAYYKALDDEEWIEGFEPVAGWAKSLEPDYVLYLGRKIGLELAHFIIPGSEWSKHHVKIKENWEKDPRLCGRLLLQWLFLRADDSETHAGCIKAVQDVLLGNDIMALFSASQTKTFTDLVNKNPRPLSEQMISFARAGLNEHPGHSVQEELGNLKIDLNFKSKDMPLSDVFKMMEVSAIETATISVIDANNDSGIEAIEWIGKLDSQLRGLHDKDQPKILKEKIGDEYSDRQFLSLIRSSNITYEVVAELGCSFSEFCVALLDNGHSPSRKINATLSKTGASWSRPSRTFAVKGNLNREHERLGEMKILFSKLDPNQEGVQLPYSIVLKNN